LCKKTNKKKNAKAQKTQRVPGALGFGVLIFHCSVSLAAEDTDLCASVV
jgi:hypothetical protein